MKKITFTLSLLLLSAIAMAQTTLLNYDDVDNVYDFTFGDTGSGNKLTTPNKPNLNPDDTGLNSSTNVRQLNILDDAPAWAGYGNRLNLVADIANNGSFISFFIRSDMNNIPIGISFSDPTGTPEEQAAAENPSTGSATYTGNGDWQLVETNITYSLDFSSGTGVDRGEKEHSYVDLIVSPNAVGSTTAFTVWFDEVVQNNAPSLSTKDFSNKEFSVYPNPATLAINIKGNITDKKASVYDLTGKLVSSKSITGKFNSVDVSALSKGIYMLVLNSGSSFKFVKE